MQYLEAGVLIEQRHQRILATKNFERMKKKTGSPWWIAPFAPQHVFLFGQVLLSMKACLEPCMLDLCMLMQHNVQVRRAHKHHALGDAAAEKNLLKQLQFCTRAWQLPCMPAAG